MKIFKKAFTLVELIVVISIITLISSSGIFYFLDFVQQQKINQKLILVEDDIKILDKKVENYSILDYELQFNTSATGNTLYISYINNFDTKKQILNIINSYGSGEIITNPNTGTGIVKIYKKQKLFLQKKINRINAFEFNFNEVPSYKILGTLSGEILNDIYLKYYSEDNLYPEKNDILKLIRISENKGNTNLGNITITNIGGNKKIGNNLNQVYLYFENNGKEDYIKIKK